MGVGRDSSAKFCAQIYIVKKVIYGWLIDCVLGKAVLVLRLVPRRWLLLVWWRGRCAKAELVHQHQVLTLDASRLLEAQIQSLVAGSSLQQKDMCVLRRIELLPGQITWMLWAPHYKNMVTTAAIDIVRGESKL